MWPPTIPSSWVVFNTLIQKIQIHFGYKNVFFSFLRHFSTFQLEKKIFLPQIWVKIWKIDEFLFDFKIRFWASKLFNWLSIDVANSWRHILWSQKLFDALWETDKLKKFHKVLAETHFRPFWGFLIKLVQNQVI